MLRIFRNEWIARLCFLILVYRFDSCVSLPTEQPTRFTLNTGNINTNNAFNIEQGWTLASESQNNAARVIASNSPTLNLEPVSFTSTLIPPVTNTHSIARETVRLENETAQGIGEKPFIKPFSGILESFVNPTPLVDGIREQDKYGNSGDKFIGIGRALVSGYEGFSNFLNAIVDFPRSAFKKTTRGLTEALNHVGARLVGLE